MNRKILSSRRSRTFWIWSLSTSSYLLNWLELVPSNSNHDVEFVKMDISKKKRTSKSSTRSQYTGRLTGIRLRKKWKKLTPPLKARKIPVTLKLWGISSIRDCIRPFKSFPTSYMFKQRSTMDHSSSEIKISKRETISSQRLNPGPQNLM